MEEKQDGIKLEFDTKQLSDEQKKQIEADFKKSQEHTVLKEVPLRPAEIDVRQLSDGEFKQMMFRYMAETEELLISIAQSCNDSLLVAMERLSPKQKERVEKIMNNREKAFKDEAEKALAQKKSN